jgi:transposase
MEVWLERTLMSERELRRVEVMARVANKGLKLVDAATLLHRSYRQVKRIWQRYQQEASALARSDPPLLARS